MKEQILEKIEELYDEYFKHYCELNTQLEENKEETLQIVADTLELDVSAVEEMVEFYDFSTELTDADKAGFQRTADFMFKNGMIENKLDVSTLFYE